ncbi:LysR family transcriptional regulator [Ignavigranum ruoffiae]|uniref:LysR family transcriptional regulator n=1 Tax=Ignavigranum ruoffiae TaxID=89093 RepID=UPI003AFFF89C
MSFLSLCETMNYRKTAEFLHLTQPAITKQIQSLESEYGTKLFRYDGRKLQRTDKSYLMESYALSEKINYQQIIELLSTENKEKLRVGLTKSIGEFVILDYLLNYFQRTQELVDCTDPLKLDRMIQL